MRPCRRRRVRSQPAPGRSEEHTSELQSLAYLVCRLLLEKKKKERWRFLSHRTALAKCQSRSSRCAWLSTAFRLFRLGRILSLISASLHTCAVCLYLSDHRLP